jgi:thiosulfate reductase cytochrome b subunit
MNRQKYLRVVNVIIALLVLSLALSGMIRKLAPSLIPYQTFSIAHPLTGFLFVFFICVHIFLNFNWIKANYFKRKKV